MPSPFYDPNDPTTRIREEYQTKDAEAKRLWYSFESERKSAIESGAFSTKSHPQTLERLDGLKQAYDAAATDATRAREQYVELLSPHGPERQRRRRRRRQ